MDIGEQEARLAQMQEETRKFVAAQHKLFAEQAKLFAVAIKPRRDHGAVPLVLGIAGVGGVAGFIAAFVTVLKVFGRL